MKQEVSLSIDKKLIEKQIDDLLNSNIPEESKSGLHNLLGEILNQIENT